MSPSVLYSVTVTLKKEMYRLTPEEQYDQTATELLRIIKGVGCTVTMVAELTSNFNLHYHLGLIFLDHKDCLKKWHNLFRRSKVFGYTCVKQVTHDAGWIEYISKDLTETRKSLGRPSIISDEFNWLSIIKESDSLTYIDAEEIIEE